MMNKINYKRELESAARGMIMVHDPRVLIKMVVRMMVTRVGVKHAGILLYDKDKNSYVLSVSRGQAGLKIPVGFARLDPQSALIRFFSEGQNRLISKEGVLSRFQAKKILKERKIFTDNPGLRDLLLDSLEQMEFFQASACIPSYLPFRPAKEKHESLVGILFLGDKKNGGKIHQDELDFFVALSSDVAMALHNAQLFDELQQELAREHRLFMHTTIALAAAIDAKDHYTHGHTERVTSYCMAIAEEINSSGRKDLDDKFKQNLHVAALLHDIGKIGVPEKILNKTSSLTEEEFKLIKEHPLVGANIVKPIRELADCIEGVKAHHERMDGKGYPRGLKGEEIPFLARIICVADAFDAMMTNRPYRKALMIQRAAKNLIIGKGAQFDPLAVDAFISYLVRTGKLKEDKWKGFQVLTPASALAISVLSAMPPKVSAIHEVARSSFTRTRRPRRRSAKRWV